MSRRDAFAALLLAAASALLGVDPMYVLLAQGLILAAWFDAARRSRKASPISPQS